MKEKIKRTLKLYLSGLFVYSTGLLIILYLPYYQKFLSQATLTTLTYLYLSYLLLAPIYYLFSAHLYPNKPFLFLRGLKRLFTRLRISRPEKTASLFLLVKIFFLPIMLNFFFEHLRYLFILKDNFSFYPFIINFLFLIDTSIFSFGYAFEFRKLNNLVKSVEPTLFGWFVALICYPPFNQKVSQYFIWGADNYVEFWNPLLTIFFRILIVFLLVIYVWASAALGPKASNLTNRGIVSKFPYSVIRHPAYISKALIWWLTLLPLANPSFFFGMFFWSLIYYFRAITEEKHLINDPDYLTYCQKVRYKFIPFVY